MGRLLTVALVVFGLLAASADAARVKVKVTTESAPDDSLGRDDTDTVTVEASFRAGHGERNHLTVHRAAKHRLRFTDSGAVITAGARCDSVSPHTAVCHVPVLVDNRFGSIDLGDRGDRLAISSKVKLGFFVDGGTGRSRVRGGAGADYVLGGNGRDRLAGGLGRDDLHGSGGADLEFGGRGKDRLFDGPGLDRLHGGPDNDTLRSDDRGRRLRADVLDGGPGLDAVSYYSRKRGVRAGVATGGGRPGEGDRFVRIERLAGGHGDDHLRGDRHANLLVGNTGFDVYHGGAGADEIRAGSDYPEGVADVFCGPGDDEVTFGTKAAELLRPDCERVAYTDVPAQPLAVSADSVTMQLPCTYEGRDVAVELRTPVQARPWYPTAPFDTLLATATVTDGTYPAQCTVVLALNEQGRALARPVPVTITADQLTWTFLLAAPAATAR